MVAGEEPVLLHPSHRARNRKGMKQNFSLPLQGRSNGDTAMRSAHLCHCRASKFFLSTHRGPQKLAGKGEMNPIEGKI